MGKCKILNWMGTSMYKCHAIGARLHALSSRHKGLAVVSHKVAVYCCAGEEM
jgi:hypothetical protein